MKQASASSEPAPVREGTVNVVLVGNPNCGKTTLFNALTGLRQKVGNYPGVTVETKEGRAVLPELDAASRACSAGPDADRALRRRSDVARLIDLPGLYSLTPHSPDEIIAREVLLGMREDIPKPDVVLNVVDATNLERNLYLTSQILDLGIPTVIALTMTDMLSDEGVRVSADLLQRAVGAPVCIVVASRREGLNGLLETIASTVRRPAPLQGWTAPESIAEEIGAVQSVLETEEALLPRTAFSEAVTLLMQQSDTPPARILSDPSLATVRATRADLERRGVDFASEAIEARYAWVAGVCEGVVNRAEANGRAIVSPSDRVDRIVMHPVWGYVIFVFVMVVVFQSIFTWVKAPMDWLKDGIDSAGAWLTHGMAPGDLRDLIRGGVLGGVGNTVVFLPQILMLFFFIGLMEDTGYMARAAFLMDRLMSKVGLHGRSFIPLLSSFACAIPGIMATRTIADRKARLITVLVAPLMSCSARLPVYALMIGAFVPNWPVLSVGRFALLTLPGVTLLSMYFLGMAAAFCAAWCFHRTLLKGVAPAFMMELPPYRLPSPRTVVLQMFERALQFLQRAGTVILAVSIVLWGLSSYPKRPDLPLDQRLQHSYVGYAGRALAPLIAPLGFDWKMGIGIVSSFVAREVFVSAMGTVYNVSDGESDAGRVDLSNRMRSEVDPNTGRRIYTPLVAVCLMVYYVLAMQCVSTLAVVRRETNGWKWPVFQFGYMTALAWIVCCALYQGGRLAGLG